MLLHSKILGSSANEILILHGFLGSGDNWISIAKKLVENNYKVHLIDQRNHGRSFHSSEFNYELMREDLLQYINHHKIYQPIIMGHSMGGKTVMNFALKHPNRLSKLFVIDTSPRFYERHHDYIIEALLRIDLKKINKRINVDLELSKTIKDLSLRNFLMKNLFWKEPNVLEFRFNLQSLQLNIDEIGKEITYSDQFKKPTYFFKGENSDYIKDVDYKSILNIFPNSKLISISNSGHWLHADNSEEFLNNFISLL